MLTAEEARNTTWLEYWHSTSCSILILAWWMPNAPSLHSDSGLALWSSSNCRDTTLKRSRKEKRKRDTLCTTVVYVKITEPPSRPLSCPRSPKPLGQDVPQRLGALLLKSDHAFARDMRIERN